MHSERGRIYSGARPVSHCTAMQSPFPDSTSSPPGEYSGEPLESSVAERILMVALVAAIAACSAALLVQ